ncbi:MAG TPA: hypothetical protein VIR16_11200 [Candidatus Limnocylindrales bacterium]
MRKVALILAVPVALCAAAGAAVVAFRRNPRIGSAFVNTVVNPRLLQRGLAGGAKSELGTLEHVGRTSGIRRLTLVHPEPTVEGFRIMVPLGPNSHWARNVIAAGHCRLQLHETVYDLDEPAIIPAAEADHLPGPVRWLVGALGFQYLKLRTFAANPGSLEAEPADASAAQQPAEPESAAAPDAGELAAPAG